VEARDGGDGWRGGLALYLYYKQQAAKGFKCTVQELQTLASTDDSARVALLKALFAKLYGAPPEQVARTPVRCVLVSNFNHACEKCFIVVSATER